MKATVREPRMRPIECKSQTDSIVWMKEVAAYFVMRFFVVHMPCIFGYRAFCANNEAGMRKSAGMYARKIHT